jgi:hypothetical protein
MRGGAGLRHLLRAGLADAIFEVRLLEVMTIALPTPRAS